MRLDRFITVALVEPLRRGSFHLADLGLRNAVRRPRLPILMYHSVSSDPEPGVGSYFRTCVSPERFAQHMEFLHAQGWRVLGLRRGLQAAAESMDKLAILTFDDGFRDFLGAAAPVLRKFGFEATMFLPTNFISEEGPPRRFAGRDCLAWPEVRRLQDLGIEIGSHTCSHPQLWLLPWPEIEAELVESKRAIEEHLGAAATSFSFPFAFPQSDPEFVGRLRDRLGQAGYRACVTTEIGRAAAGDDPFRLKRLPINEGDDPALFAAKLDGAYDWLAAPQRARKVLRRALSGASLRDR